MHYYILEHDINPGDKYVSWEADGNLERAMEGKPFPKTYYQGEFDTDFISGHYGISAKAKDFFLSLNIPHLEFVPVTVHHIKWEESMEIFLMKVNKEIDCVDYEQSDLFMLSDKKIRRVRKLVVKKDSINEDIFTIHNLLHSVTVSEALKNKITEYGLKGFRFVPTNKYPIY
ncbi:hypothetical protein ABH942_002266 [Flavobacterium sp. 28YEA47A]